MSSVISRGAARRCARALPLVFLLGVSTPVTAATHDVPAGGDLQAALNAAQPGDVILLAPGATYVGNFRLPAKPGDAFITLRTGGPESDLPPPGVRIGPAYAAVLAKIQSPSNAPALSTAAGAHHWRIELIEFLPNRNGAGDIIALGDSGQTQEAQMPRDLVLDRLYVHGDPVIGQKRGVALNSGLTHITNSYFEHFKVVGQDSQGICGWNGSGPYLIENNHIEAAGENVMFGGADPKVWNLVPSDITVRRNVFTKPLSWRQERWSVKNAFELKNARRVLIEGNIFEHVWQGGQAGYAVVFTVRNQDGAAPWSVIEDVTFRYNIVRHAGAGINIMGFDNNHASAQTRRLQIAHNLFYDIDRSRWGGNGDFVQVGNGPRDITIEKNTVLHSGNALHPYGKQRGAAWPIEAVVFRDNLLRHNNYGVIGDGSGVGHPTLSAYFPGIVFERNVLAGGSPGRYPAGNYFPSVEEFESQFVDAAAGNFDLSPVSPFRTAASDGGALGADLNALHHVVNGGASPGLEFRLPGGDEAAERVPGRPVVPM